MAKKHAPRDEPGRYAYDGLDRVLHEKARLGIMTSLVTRSEGAIFNELKRLCALTDGNLSRHVDVLQEAGLVEAWRGTEGGRPQTLYRLSAEGARDLSPTWRSSSRSCATRCRRPPGAPSARRIYRRDSSRREFS